MPVQKITSIADTKETRVQRKSREKHNIEEVIDHSMGLLVTGVTRIVERIYLITCIRPGRCKLFPQLVISFSFITLLDRETTGQRNWDQLANIHMTSRRPHWCTKTMKRWPNGGHTYVSNKSCGRWTLSLSKKLLLFHTFAWCWPRE